MNALEFRALLMSAYGGDLVAIRSALVQDPELIHHVEHDRTNIFHFACMGGHFEVVRFLLEKGCNLHAKTINPGCDALYYVVTNKNIPLATFLLNQGADPCTKTNNWTALGSAASLGDQQMCLLLLSYGADIEETMSCGRKSQNRNALEIYGDLSSLSQTIIKERRAALIAAWRSGPHISQVRRRNWERRWPFMKIIVGHGILPMGYIRDQQTAAALPTSVRIPPLMFRTRTQRSAVFVGRVLGNIHILKIVVSYI